jgi:hypothetical protein
MYGLLSGRVFHVLATDGETNWFGSIQCLAGTFCARIAPTTEPQSPSIIRGQIDDDPEPLIASPSDEQT